MSYLGSPIKQFMQSILPSHCFIALLSLPHFVVLCTGSIKTFYLHPSPLRRCTAIFLLNTKITMLIVHVVRVEVKSFVRRISEEINGEEIMKIYIWSFSKSFLFSFISKAPASHSRLSASVQNARHMALPGQAPRLEGRHG